ncbi:beta-alanyl-dopamine/carcinine hydrolase-like [Liolophura sinensis]|uniref:beta-alanyl-dopamine/carcinine hydrolase-like n=1 Tax=Liolophura sinensis TaxID=3198878 RepID=UPI003158EC4C
MIIGFMEDNDILNEEFLPFIRTEKGQQLYDGYLRTVQKHYPQYVEELRGMAEATGVPFSKFFAAALRPELSSIIDLDRHGNEGCTDIYVKTSKQLLLGHTEDLSRSQEGRVFILHATISSQTDGQTDNAQVQERFTAITCAGMLPGNTFGLLPDCGLIYTINDLYPVVVDMEKIPRQVVNRAMLASEDFSDMQQRCACPGVGIANGFCANIGNLSQEPELWTIEVAPVPEEPRSRLEKRQFQPASSASADVFVHVNRYELLEVEEIPERLKSSAQRCKRISELPAPADIPGLQHILGDEQGEHFPIFNHNMKSDVETLFAVIVDLTKALVYVYSKNPKLGPSNILPIS